MHNSPKAGRGMRDVSPGASPTRPSGGEKRAASPVIQMMNQPGSYRGMRDRSPGASPTRPSGGKRASSPVMMMNQQGGYFGLPPQQSFQPPSSPVRPPVSSRPTTPVNTNRPPSRSSSPFSARPGLQEDDDGDDSVISARSPGRSFSSNSNINMSSGMSTVNNLSSGMSTLNIGSGMSTVQQQQQHPSGVPLGGGGSSHHRRSGSVDSDVVRKPMPPRALSQSPMRRPAPSNQDDDGDLQPAPPRAFSQSPSGRRHARVYDVGKADEKIQLPDLSMPSFAPDPSLNGETLFTPPPRAMPAPRMPANMNDDDDDDESPPTKRENNGKTPFPGAGLQPRASAFEANGVQFQVGGIQPPNPKTRREMVRQRSDRTKKAFTGVPARSPPLPGVPLRSPPRDEIFSPMDIDDPSPVSNPSSVASPPRVVEGIAFNMGTKPPDAAAARRPRPWRPGKAASEIPLPRSTDNSFDYGMLENAEGIEVQIGADKNNSNKVDYTGKVAFLHAKREEGKTHYMNADLKSSILAYTEAIKIYEETSNFLPSDTVAVLLSNRAAGLLMIGALEAAVANCQLALRNVTKPRSNEPFSNDSGLLLKIKLHTRLARGFLKLGDHSAAHRAFTDAMNTADEATAFSRANHSPQVFRQHQATITQMTTEATLGQGDAKRLRDSLDKLSKCTMESLKNLSERSKYAEVLGHVNIALSIASGCPSLIEKKVNLLVQMKRWREVAGYLERLAAWNVHMDGVFVEDLEPQNPFPGVLPAQALKADFFGNARDEDSTTKELKLSSRACGEGVLRLPYSLTSIYIRALRLEERYPGADAALRALEDILRRGNRVHDFHYLQTQFGFIPKERSKLKRTKDGREKGDELFRGQEFDLAGAEYAACLKIDAEGLPDSHDGSTAGGRLHAVLHCNRAACLMALRRFNGAVEECSAALKIHSRYMKAILRRARCYTRLQRTQEAISEYKRWLDLVEDARKTGQVPLSPCLFDGPKDVKPAEIHQTQKELDDVLKAKRRAEASAREEADRRRERERGRFHETFSSSWRSAGAGVGGVGGAQQRRDQWYNQRGADGNRRWDSFTNRGPRSSSIPRNPQGGHSASWSEHNTRSSSQGRQRQDPLVSPRADNTSDHYSILNIAQNATADDIKRAFRKLALKYHPDKNKEEGAIDNFRRVKLAHEVLCDPVKRRAYDAELRPTRRYG